MPLPVHVARLLTKALHALTCLAAMRVAYVTWAFFEAGAAQRRHVESAWFILVAVAGLAIVLRPATANASAAEVKEPRSNERQMVSGLGLLAAALLLYWPSLSVGLLSDDFVLLAASPLGPENWTFFRPLPLLVLAVVHGIGGALGLHLLNVGLHALNAWLVTHLAAVIAPESTTGSRLLCGALFLTFPAAVEAVTWASGVFDLALVTCSLLFLLTVARGSTYAAYAAPLILVAALLTKETAVALPFLGALLWRTAPVSPVTLCISGAVAITYAVLRSSSTDVPWPDGALRYVLKEQVVRPFTGLALPWRAVEIDSYRWWLGIAPVVTFVGLLVGYVLGGRARRRILGLALWPIVATLPLIGYLFIGADLENSRYLYLPLIGWVVLLVELATHGITGRTHQVAHVALWTVCVVGAVGARVHQHAWTQAAALRDTVLASVDSVRDTGCGVATFAEVPDNTQGAYVFRNGFQEAVAATARPTRPAPSSPPPQCAFTWTANGFAASATPSGVRAVAVRLR